MLPTDQTHLRRYFATLGVAIAAGTLSLAGLFLSLQQDLLVPQSTLAKLTPTARNALMRRQEYLSLGTTILPWFVLVGFLIGIGLTAYGMIGWARRQKVIDEREDIGLRKERFELRQLTETEKAEKLDRDAKESVIEASSTPAGTPAGTSPNDLTEEVRAARTEISFVQLNLEEKLSGIYDPANVLAPAIFRATSGEGLEIDAVVMRKVNPILFELKYALEPPILSGRTLERLRQVARVAIDAKGRAVLIIVVSDYAPSRLIEDWTEQVSQIAADYYSVLGFYVGKYSDFIALSAREFAAKVELDYKTRSGFTPYMDSGNRWEPLNPELNGR